MDRSHIAKLLPSIVAAHVPRNARSCKYQTYDDQPSSSKLGFHIDPTPFVGKVIALTADAIVVKTGRTQFAVIDRQLATADPAEGATVHVEPYARRRFDGLRADTPQEETRYTADGQPYAVTTHILGSAPASLPIPAPQCPELGELITQLETLPAPDGFRRITHMLVDAGARDFTWVDPQPARIIETPPAISFSVSTAKFEGRVTVLYDRGRDTYVIELHQGDKLVERQDEVYFDVIGQAIERLIDDGQWRRIRVSVIDEKPNRKQRSALPA